MRQLSPEQHTWINTHYSLLNYDALCGDAGFRRYFRLHTPAQTLIFMDASEEPAIYHAFIQQSEHLSRAALPIPRLLVRDNVRAWAILEDFGDDLLFNLFQSNEGALPIANHFYRQALDHALTLHQYPVKAFGRFSVLDDKVILEELQGWQQWCLEGLFQHSASPELLTCFQTIRDIVMQQPYIFMHRDFHSKNLLRKPDGSIGIIDYQDAMYGPITYDLASLLRDCYVNWPEPEIAVWVLYYKHRAQACGLLNENIDDELFLYWFDWTSIQRHLKALFTFARKSLRDNNDHYLQFIPRTLQYLEDISSRYTELSALNKTIQLLREKPGE